MVTHCGCGGGGGGGVHMHVCAQDSDSRRLPGAGMSSGWRKGGFPEGVVS